MKKKPPERKPSAGEKRVLGRGVGSSYSYTGVVTVFSRFALIGARDRHLYSPPGKVRIKLALQYSLLMGGALCLPLTVWAQACSTVQPTCKTTTASYKGDLGGYAGADAKCAAEFSDYRFARDPSSVFLAADAASLAAAPDAWMDSRMGPSGVNIGPLFAGGTMVGYAEAYNTCKGWTKSVDVESITPYNYNGVTISQTFYAGASAAPRRDSSGAIYSPALIGNKFASIPPGNYHFGSGGLSTPGFNVAFGSQSSFCSESHPIWCCNF